MIREKKVDRLLRKNYSELTITEKIEIAYEKYYNKQKITYEEYVLMLATNDEIYFLYANDEYQIVYDTSESVSMCITEFKGAKKVSGRSESFLSIIELLDKFRIEGKRIRDIWDEVTF